MTVAERLDAIDMLLQDHRRLTGLLGQLGGAAG
jgi:hypothetical protein